MVDRLGALPFKILLFSRNHWQYNFITEKRFLSRNNLIAELSNENWEDVYTML